MTSTKVEQVLSLARNTLIYLAVVQLNWNQDEKNTRPSLGACQGRGGSLPDGVAEPLGRVELPRNYSG